MKQNLIKILFIFFVFFMILIPTTKVQSATFADYTLKYKSTYLVPLGKEIRIFKSNSETVSTSNTNIARVYNDKLQIIGSGSFTVTVKSDTSTETYNFFAWNAYLKRGKYYTYGDINLENRSGILCSKTYLAVSKENAKSLKINDYFFKTGSFRNSNTDLIGNYITNYYNDNTKTSKVAYYQYSFDIDFDVGPVEIPIESLEFDKTSIELTTGKTGKLTLTIKPSNATNKNVIITSDNPSVATLDSDGTVHAHKAGKTTITASSYNGKSATCQITVKDAPSDDDNFEIHFINSGSRVDAIFLRTKDVSIFIDGGYKKDVNSTYLTYLKKLGVTHIDYYLGSHSHRDHVEAAPLMISKFGIKTIFLGREKDGGTPAVKKAINVFAKEQKLTSIVNKCSFKVLKPGNVYHWGKLTMTCIGPLSVTTLNRGDVKQNYNSLVLRFDFGDISFLTGGDNSSTTTFKKIKSSKYASYLKGIDIYKNNHHNGDNSSIYGLIKPKYVVFPTGNSRLPSSSTISKVKKAGVSASNIFVIAKSKQNHVVFVTNGEKLKAITKYTPSTQKLSSY